MTLTADRIGRDMRTLVKSPSPEAVNKRIIERHFVPPVEMSVSPNRSRMAVIGSDFGDQHHERITQGFSDQFYRLEITLPQIISERSSKKFDIEDGSFGFATLMDHVPKGTVGIWVTDPGVNSIPDSDMARDEVIIQTYAGNFGVMPNNGLATILNLSQGIARAWKIDTGFFLGRYNDSSSCQGEDLFAPAAAFVAMDSGNISHFAEPIDRRKVVTFPVKVGQAIGSDRFGQVRYALYLPPEARAVDIQTERGEMLENIPVQNEGGFANLTQLSVYRSSGFKLRGEGLAEVTINQGEAINVVGRHSKIVKVRM